MEENRKGEERMRRGDERIKERGGKGSWQE